MNNFIKLLRLSGLILIVIMSMGAGIAMAVPMPSMKKKEDTIEVVDQRGNLQEKKTVMELDASMFKQ